MSRNVLSTSIETWNPSDQFRGIFPAISWEPHQTILLETNEWVDIILESSPKNPQWLYWGLRFTYEELILLSKKYGDHYHEAFQHYVGNYISSEILLLSIYGSEHGSDETFDKKTFSKITNKFLVLINILRQLQKPSDNNQIKLSKLRRLYDSKSAHDLAAERIIDVMIDDRAQEPTVYSTLQKATF